MEASIPEQVLQPLLLASDSSHSLEECLQFLIEASKTDSGRSKSDILPSILSLLQLLPYPSSRHHLNLSLKVLRNLCAGETRNQEAFVDHNGCLVISELLDSAIGDVETVRFGLQVLANVVVMGENRQRDVWLRLFPERFLAVSQLRRRETCDPLCMILYICFDGSSSRSEIASQLCSDDGLNIIAESLRTSSSVGSVEDYWLKLLVSRLCVEGDCFPGLFSKLGHEDSAFTSEHAFLLWMVSDIANERLKEVSIPKDTAHFVLGLLRQSVEVFDFVLGEKTELPTGSAVVDVMGYSLVIIRDACAGGSLEELKNANNDSGSGNVEMLLSSGLIDLLLDLLRKLDPPTTINKALQQSPTSSSSGRPCPYRGFRRDIVAVIGNCAYRRKEVQDEIRERDGLFVMLQQCVTDDENPFLREWGLWCVRNLLEGNEENQKAVAELEMQGSVDVPQLREIGLRVEIDPVTSRPKLVNDTTT